MKMVVISDEELKLELLSLGHCADNELVWLSSVEQLEDYKTADIYCDLLFEPTASRVSILQKLQKPVVINSVAATLTELNFPCVRINGWAGFLKGQVIEAASPDPTHQSETERFFDCFHKRLEWLPDESGFVAARIVAMIINEAYFALQEKVSTKEEIDTAMKLGTNYPYGPFEWCDKIGIKKIYSLLRQLGQTHVAYRPAALLEQEALA